MSPPPTSTLRSVLKLATPITRAQTKAVLSPKHIPRILSKHAVTSTVTSGSTAAIRTPTTPDPEAEVCLHWNTHYNNMRNSFPDLLLKEQFVDVTLAAGGKVLKCHKVSFNFRTEQIILFIF